MAPIASQLPAPFSSEKNKYLKQPPAPFLVTHQKKVRSNAKQPQYEAAQ